MNINVIASGSTGNVTLISHKGNKLLIDAGINIKRIMKALNYNLIGIDGVLISHEHKDHSYAVSDLMKLSVDCYMSKGTARELRISGHRLKILSSKKLKIGNFYIQSFDLIHDAIEPFGFLIMIENWKILYAIDTAYLPYRFNNLTHIMIECNYSVDIVKKKIATQELSNPMKNRLFKSHMSFETCKKFFLANDLNLVQEIWLMHLSDRHSDKNLFKDEIQKLTGKLVKIK